MNSTQMEPGVVVRPRPAGAVRLVAVVVAGLGVGALTSMLQTYLNFPWLSLVNAASPWLTPMFLLGSAWRRPRAAALAGLSTGLLEVAGYYLTASARGYSPGGQAILVFWIACAVAGGPVFGAAGWAWRRTGGRWRQLGGAVLPAAFLAEALVTYLLRLHYLSSAVLFAVLGIAAAALLGIRERQYASFAAGLLITLPAAIAAELALGLIYNQPL